MTSSFQKFNHLLDKTLVPFGEKLSNMKYLRSIRDGMICATPLSIIGGICLIISSPPVDLNVVKPTNIFFEFLIAWKKFAIQYGMEIELPYRMTMAMMALFIAIGIAYSLAKEYKMDPLGSLITSAVTFMVVSAPSQLGILSTVIKDGMTTSDVLGNQGIVMATQYLGAEGIFTAMIIAILTVEITRYLKQHNIVVKMPDAVPPAIAASFSSIIPMALCVIIFYAFSLLAQSVAGVLIPAMIMNFIKPLISVVDSPFGIIFISVITQLLWLVGLHGSSIVSAVVGAFEVGNLANNAALVTSGKEAVFIYTEPFRAFFMIIGGAGATFAIVILLLRSRCAQLKALGKLAILPSIFNINEPVIFGLPLVLNPIMAIPFILVQTVNGILAYGVMSIGLVGKTFAVVPWTTPAPIGAFLSTMDIKAFLFVIILLGLDILMYYPFLKAYERQLLMEEKKLQEENERNAEAKDEINEI